LEKYNATLTATASNDCASLVILATTEGKLALDMISFSHNKPLKTGPMAYGKI
jgi:hypothetical protein